MSWLRTKLGRGAERAAQRAGWRDLVSRRGSALTRYVRAATRLNSSADLPSWAVLPGDAWETAQSIIVRVEMPGMTRENLDVRVEWGRLKIRGEKHSANEPGAIRYHLMERAFGRFERTLPLPSTVESTPTEVSVQHGVVTIILQKKEPLPPTPPTS